MKIDESVKLKLLCEHFDDLKKNVEKIPGCVKGLVTQKLFWIIVSSFFLFSAGSYAYTNQHVRDAMTLHEKINTLQTKFEVMSNKLDTMNTKLDCIAEFQIKKDK